MQYPAATLIHRGDQGCCATYREEALRRQLVVGPHEPGRCRAVGALVNLAKFHEAFGIQPGDPR